MSLLDNLFDDSDTKWLKETCPALFKDNKIVYSSGGSMKQVDIGMSNSGDYYEIVESGNEYVKELLDKEEKYLKSKYGDSLYNYFIGERTKYIERKKQDFFGDCEDNNYNYEQLSEIYDIYKQLTKKENKEKSKQNDSGLLDSRKFFYRNETKSNIEDMSKRVTMLYYFIIVSVFFYLFVNNELFIFKRWIIYLFILMIPLVIKYPYAFLRYIYYSMKKQISNKGPDNAFLQETFV
tara:strand:- start:201 stop:908 length:708 start_codon:yes stop_codon:yes gene_type:complete